jgi:uncharacterized protein (TIGR02231 family)
VTDFASAPKVVTLFEDRAEVVRTAEVAVAAGVSWVGLTGVTLIVDDASVQAKVLEGAGVRVLGARVRRRAAPDEDRTAALQAEAEERAAHSAKSLAQGRMSRAGLTSERVADVAEAWADGLGRARHLAGEGATQWRESWARLSEARFDVVRTGVQARHDHTECARAFGLATKRSIAAQNVAPRWEAVVEVQVEAEVESNATLEVVYRTPCALWRPEHLARLTAPEEPGGPQRVELLTWATAWQNTGEAWTNVDVRFSTARPASAADAPALDDDVLVSRVKSAEERKTLVVESREQVVETATAVGEADSSEMPGVDDGGVPVLFRAPEPVSIPSNGQPVRIEVGRRMMDAQVERVLTPAQSKAPHHRASMTLTGGAPLLAGPMRLARGESLVGRSKVQFVGAGEPLELGFGPDDSIRASRVSTEERSTATLTGKQTIQRKVQVHISNLSGEAKTLRVTDRIPVSEIDAVKIVLRSSQGWALDGTDGFLEAEVTLEGRGYKLLEFAYDVVADSDVRLPF